MCVPIKAVKDYILSLIPAALAPNSVNILSHCMSTAATLVTAAGHQRR